MRLAPLMFAALAGVSAGAASLSAQNVLFVGNSFTFVPRSLSVGEAVELNGGAAGGVPSLFQALAVAGGKSPVVTMEAVGGKHLSFHYETKRELIDKPWDIVVFQDYSTGPLIENGKRESYESFRTNLEKLRDLVRAQNPDVKIYVYETWGRPDRVMKGNIPSVESMHEELHQAYADAVKDFGLAGRVPVGCSFMAAVHEGVADNPATADVVEGPVKIWGGDNYHQSGIGAYLSALTFYGRIYDADPRELPADNVAAEHVKLDAETSKKLQAIAWEQLEANR